MAERSTLPEARASHLSRPPFQIIHARITSPHAGLKRSRHLGHVVADITLCISTAFKSGFGHETRSNTQPSTGDEAGSSMENRLS